VFGKVILPQVWPLVLPPLANVAVATIKLTAILSILAINDLMKVANRINTFRVPAARDLHGGRARLPHAGPPAHLGR
jgi:ABC-type amino acid transport system permease subunit